MTYYEAIHAMQERVHSARRLMDTFATLRDQPQCTPEERAYNAAKAAKWAYRRAVRNAALARLKSGLA